jgi:retron-type reverse transcriptase
MSNITKPKLKTKKNQHYIDGEKIRLKTPRMSVVTDLIEYYKKLGSEKKSSTALILQGIYNKNCKAASKGQVVTNERLLSVVSKPETLLLAYAAIKGNKGALTAASPVSEATFNNFNEQQKRLYLSSYSFPNKLSLDSFFAISALLKKGQYTWGTSLRIMIPKPGSAKLRPLTIPPFMDRLVQKAIQLVLEAIYEPYFESMNRSFGFRANKGTLDAITALTSKKTNGMRTAIEGDIQAAYDTVNKEKLLAILGKRIKDKKFLELISSRLKYEFVMKDTGERVTPEDGIPQGGIDAPYLWNIYMLEFDNFVHTKLQDYVDELNGKYADPVGESEVDQAIPHKRQSNKIFTSNRAFGKKLLRSVKSLKSALVRLSPNSELAISKRAELFSMIRQVRLNNHQKNKISSAPNNKRFIRIFLVRYADDFILLTNGGVEVGIKLKAKLAEFLKTELGLVLSESKTVVTDITRKYAHFLGFELKGTARGPLRRIAVTRPKNSIKKFTLSRISGLLLWVQPDRQRLINRFHMKGFCDKNGFPLGLPWLSCLEPQVILERTNAVIRGFANFYLPSIRNRAKISRWIYILRFSCLKTLAQKYKCSIKKVFKRFGCNMRSRSTQTVEFTVIQKYGQDSFKRSWQLLTYSDLVSNENYLVRGKDMLRSFWDIEKGKIGDYPLRIGKRPSVTNSNFIKPLSWNSWRTMANFGMPCAACGTFEGVQMHHIKHVRKREYALIPNPDNYTQIMALRNRKQLPLCQVHHMDFVHKGKYNGPRLMKLVPTVTSLFDNRIIHLESFIKPGKEYTAKSLIEKGWELITPEKK